MKTKDPINYALLRRVKARILKEPRQFHMASWFESEAYCLDQKRIPNCGTAACIGGWAVAIHNKLNPAEANGHFMSGMNFEAKTALGLTADQALGLFSEFEWPERFGKKYMIAKSAKTRSKAAAARIDHFIRTKGAE